MIDVIENLNNLNLTAAEENYQKGVSLYWSCKYKEALDCLTQAADKEYPAAYLYLMCIYRDDIKDKKQMAIFNQKISENIDWFHEQAKTGSALAQYNLGYLYEKGLGVNQDCSEAARLYKLAADQGLAVAQCNLGWPYRYGLGVKQGYSEAFRYYTLAADQGLAAAQYNLGYLYRQGLGVNKDCSEAARLYKLAADQGLAVAQLYLGISYEFGKGVKQDYSEAFRYYTLAADQGLHFAQNNLSMLSNEIYQKGREYENKKDFVEAARLYKFLADQGLNFAKKNLSIMSNEIYREGEKYEHKAWKHYSDYYFCEAFRLYKLAADLGHMSAKERLTGERFTDPLLRNALMRAVNHNNSDVVKSLLEFKGFDFGVLKIARDKNYTVIQDLISEAKLVRYIDKIQSDMAEGKETDGLWGTPKSQKLEAAKAFLEFYRKNGQGDISQHIAALTEEGTFTKSNLFEIVFGFSEHYTSAVLKQKAELEFKAKEPNYTPSFWDNFSEPVLKMFTDEEKTENIRYSL